jgi:L-threonylcarbamoyladenylate synthase
VTVKVNSKNYARCIDDAVDALRGNELIVYPTDTVYGLGADATSKRAAERVYAVKKKPLHENISVLVSDLEMLERYAKLNNEQRELIYLRAPGPYTFAELRLRKKLFVTRTGRAGFRLPDHWCTEIVRELGKPITATSANIHGKAEPRTVNDAKKAFGAIVSLYIDSGRLAGKPSRVIDMSSFRVIRG